MTNRIRSTLQAISVTAAAALLLAGCAGTSSATSSNADPASTSTDAPASTDEKVAVVASTDVYGSVAEAIGGDRVEVTSLIVGTAQDPHEFEATAQDQLVVSEADLVVLNGAGYDDFMTTLVGDADIPEVSAEAATGLTEEGMGAEHFWYSLEGMDKVAAAIADELTTLDPDGESTYSDGLATFTAEIDELASTVGEVSGCSDIVMSEPVSGYLLEAAGCTDVTPSSFAAAIETGTGVSVGDLQDVLDLIDDGSLSFLALNTQTEGPEGEQIESAAETAGTQVVKFSETLPDGDDYVSWMTQNVDNISAALQ